MPLTKDELLIFDHNRLGKKRVRRILRDYARREHCTVRALASVFKISVGTAHSIISNGRLRKGKK